MTASRPTRPSPTLPRVRAGGQPADRPRVRGQAPAIVVFFAVLVLWQGLVATLNLQQFILPRPSAIATAFVASWDRLQETAGNTPVRSARRAL